jgi:hypothetical protein
MSPWTGLFLPQIYYLNKPGRVIYHAKYLCSNLKSFREVFFKEFTIKYWENTFSPCLGKILTQGLLFEETC